MSWQDKNGRLHDDKTNRFVNKVNKNPIPMASDLDRMQIEQITRNVNNITKAYNGKLVDIDIGSIRTMQENLRYNPMLVSNKENDLPVVINLQNRVNVAIDGNHRIVKAMQMGDKKIKVRLTKHTDYI